MARVLNVLSHTSRSRCVTSVAAPDVQVGLHLTRHAHGSAGAHRHRQIGHAVLARTAAGSCAPFPRECLCRQRASPAIISFATRLASICFWMLSLRSSPSEAKYASMPLAEARCAACTSEAVHRNREPGRNTHAELGHLAEVRALLADEVDVLLPSSSSQ